MSNSKRQIEAARRAVEAAEMSLARGIPASEAAVIVGAGLTTTWTARVVLDHGTAEEVEALRAGASVMPLAKQIRARSVGPLRSVRPNVKSAKANDRRRLQADVWKHLSQGILGLSGLPSANDTVAIVRANPKRRKLIDEKLLSSLNWLMEFSDAWTK